MSTRYTISWIYEDFRICQYNRNKLISSWHAPFPVMNLEDFDRCFIEASKEMKLKNGAEVSIAFESDLHSHSFLELPPMSKKDLEQYLARNIDKEKNFSDEAAWSYRSTERGSKGEGVLVHIMPKKMLQNIIRVCEKHKLEPRKILPLTEIMAQHIPRLPSKDEGVIILVALFNHHVEIVVADGFGESYFVRELNIDWSQSDLSRLKLDIERTLLYSKQQFDNASHIWIMGVGSTEIAETLNESFKVPVEADPNSNDENFWASEINFLPIKLSSNFVPHSLQSSFTRRAAIKRGKFAAAASVLLALGSSILTESIKLDGNHQLQQQVSELEHQYQELEIEYQNKSKTEEQLALLLSDPEPIPAWLLYELGNIIPDSMHLSRAEIIRASNHWRLLLEGASNPTLASSATDLGLLAQRLSSPPWNIKVSPSWKQDWLEKLRQGKANDDGLLAFRMEGQF